MKVQGYADLADLEEDDRIELIAKAAKTKMQNGQYPEIAFVTDNSPKADRYIEKLKKIDIGIRVIGRWPGPTQHAYTVKLQYDGGSVQ